jgi:multiple sugar transport system ATP-binding protein
MAKKRATLRHGVTKGKRFNFKLFFFVIFVAPCEKLIFYELIIINWEGIREQTVMTQIRLENITKTFGPATVIKGLDLTISEGEFFTFVGPSGCGKSTLLNMIAGLEPVTEGSIFFDDQPVNQLSPKERDVAMVFQSYALYPHMTVYENIAFPLRMKKIGRDALDSEVRRIAEFLGLEDLLTRKPKELSGGQRQRVALGRAIIRKPRVFLMDEPLSNLDARLRIEMRAELKRLHQELGITTVYVTHDQGEAMGLSDRIAVLNKGEIQQCDTPRNVYRKPVNSFVGGFIGSPPMNFLRCAVKQTMPLLVDCKGVLLSPVSGGIPGSPEVLIGVRPEDLLVESVQRDKGIPVIVSVIEPAGAFNWVDFAWHGIKLKARSRPEDELRPRTQAYLTISPDTLLAFDGVTGASV